MKQKQTENKKVLVVDDDSDMRIFLSTLLNTYGFEPIAARDAVQGLQKATDLNPACIILNVMMSDDNGIDLYVKLKLDEKLKKTPVIMLSAIARKAFFHYQKFPNCPGQEIAEPEAYLEKPPDVEELIRCINLVVRSGK